MARIALLVLLTAGALSAPAVAHGALDAERALAARYAPLVRLVSQDKECGRARGAHRQLAFTDNGDPGVGKDTQVTYPGVDSASPCPVPLFGYQPELALIDGNYVVRDTQP